MIRPKIKICIGLLLAACAFLANAQDYPNRQIKIIIPFAPGASSDMLGRVIGTGLSERLKQTVIVENVSGASGNIGANLVAKSAPDGYTLVVGSIGTHATNGLIYPKMPYNTEDDFLPISLIASVSIVLVVHPSLPVNSVQELVEYLKKRPGEISYASGGVGASQHLAGELFKYIAKVDMNHIPYKGSAGSLTDLLSGRVPIMFADLPLVLQYIKNGSLKALAVGDLQRSPVLPTTPTLVEAGVPEYQANAWYGLFAPAKTPTEIITKLQTQVSVILRDPEIRTRLISQGANPSGNTPAEFRAFQINEIKRWRPVIQAAQIKLE